MSAHDAQKLGEFIFDQNPYAWPVTLDAGKVKATKHGVGAQATQAKPFKKADLECGDERYMEGLFWALGGRVTHRMAKAVRIEYECPSGETYALVIGYEGGGGGM